MKYVTGNLLYADEEAIGHGVNCKGLMGAGVAKAIRDEFPEISGAYIQWCHTTAEPGQVQLYKTTRGKVIVNMATQNLPGADARYEWVAQAAEEAIRELHKLGINRLAIPRIGAGIGGLDWEAVETILKLTEKVSLLHQSGHSMFQFVVYTPEVI